MNIVQFWEQQVAKWDAEQKCGMCWHFEAPMTESAVSIIQPPEGKECCVQVFLVRERVNAFTTTYNYNANTNLVNQVRCTTNFQLYVLIKGDIGTNNHTEIKGHTTEKSKWDDILWKIEECLSCDALIDFCTFLGYNPNITNWSGQQVVNYLDQAYAGYKLTVGFQQIK